MTNAYRKMKKNTIHNIIIDEKENGRRVMRICIQIACSMNGAVCRKEKPPGKLRGVWGAINHQQNTKIEMKPTYIHRHVYKHTDTHSHVI